jgi:hypothetical protein
MIKNLCIILFLISLVLLAHDRILFSQEIDPEEYKIYQVVIEEKYLSKPGYIDFLNQIRNGQLIDLEKHVFKDPEVLLPKTIIIVNETINRGLGSDINEIFDPQFKNNKAKKSLIQSWGKINAKKYVLKDSFIFQTEHLLITEDQLWEALTPSRWITFYEHYPKALGCFWLSRVAYDDNKIFALVYIKNTQDGLWGSGTFYLLSRSDDKKWNIIKEFTDIIS